jgi:hypothetical protein
MQARAAQTISRSGACREIAATLRDLDSKIEGAPIT